MSMEFKREVWIASLGASGGRSSPRSLLEKALHGFGGKGVIGATLAKDQTFKFFKIMDGSQSQRKAIMAPSLIAYSLLAFRMHAMVVVCHVLSPLLLTGPSGML